MEWLAVYFIRSAQSWAAQAVHSQYNFATGINGPIEKCWRECQRRVLARATEINGLADHRRIVEEEWAGLEFDRTEHWCGINHLVLCMEDILEDRDADEYAV